jgi:hypothetical protein
LFQRWNMQTEAHGIYMFTLCTSFNEHNVLTPVISCKFKISLSQTCWKCHSVVMQLMLYLHYSALQCGSDIQMVILTDIWTPNSWKKDPTAPNSHSPSQDIPYLLWNMTAHYHVHNSLPRIPDLSQMHPIRIFPTYSSKIHSNIILPSQPRSSEHPIIIKTHPLTPNFGFTIWCYVSVPMEIAMNKRNHCIFRLPYCQLVHLTFLNITVFTTLISS